MTRAQSSLFRISAILLGVLLIMPVWGRDAAAQEVILGENWQAMPGRAKDIGASADGSVWIIGENQSPYK